MLIFFAFNTIIEYFFSCKFLLRAKHPLRQLKKETVFIITRLTWTYHCHGTVIRHIKQVGKEFHFNEPIYLNVCGIAWHRYLIKPILVFGFRPGKFYFFKRIVFG